MGRIAIIGAGIAGLTAARELADQHDVVVYDKGRGVGGRMATRYADPYRFDHGAQFFTARSRRFRDYLLPFIDAGHIAVWHARFAEMTRDTNTAGRQWGEDYPHYVGVPGMNALPKAMAAGLDIRIATRVTGIEAIDNGWRLIGETGPLDQCDWLIVTAPAAQTAALLGPLHGELGLADKTAMRACYAVMLGFAEDPPLAFDAARVLDADISWISRNSSKPGRDAPFTVVVHATNAWADENTDLDIAAVQQHLLGEFEAVTGIDRSAALRVDTHRWRYANTPRQDGPGHLLSREHRLGVCGDWMIRGRVEAAFRSAMDLVDALRDGRSGAD